MRILQIIGVIVATISMATVVYVNLIAPRMNPTTKTEVIMSPPVPVTQQRSFRSLKPRRVPTDDEINAAVENIGQLHGFGEVNIVGDPIVVSLHSADSDQLAVVYEAMGKEGFLSGVEVFDLSSTSPKSIFHQEGEDFNLHIVSVEEEIESNISLLLEERTGATGLFLHLTFLEYDGFGKMREFYALRDLHNALLYPLQNQLLLERDHSFFELVKESSLVRLVDYEIEGRLGFHVISYGVQGGAWHIKHNRETLLSEEKPLLLSPGEELFLVRDPQNETLSTRTLIEGPALEYVEGPPVHIRAAGEGEGAILFLNDSAEMDGFTLPVRVATQN